jgi:hypothetical protein
MINLFRSDGCGDFVVVVDVGNYEICGIESAKCHGVMGRLSEAWLLCAGGK